MESDSNNSDTANNNSKSKTKLQKHFKKLITCRLKVARYEFIKCA